MTAAHDLVRHGLKIGALQIRAEGWRLKSGRRSPYFWNSALFQDAK